MAKFRKKPVVIEAVQWTGCASQLLLDMATTEDRELSVVSIGATGDQLHIKTLEGVMVASPGDWIIRGVKGELYPCKPDIFEATYEPAD